MRPRPPDLERDERPGGGRAPPRGHRRRQVGRREAEPGQVRPGQVHPAQGVIFGHVPDEVRHLEREPELARGLARRGPVARPEDRQHHRADRRGRARHVGEQVGVAVVPGDGEVGRHAGEEPAEVVEVEVEDPDRVQDGRQQRVVHRHAVEARQEPRGPRGQAPGPVGGGQVGSGVDDVVGVAAEPVERMDVPALPGGQEPGGEVVAAAVPPVQPPAALVRRREGVHEPEPLDAKIDATSRLR